MLLSNLNLLATAPGGVARLRELILTLAVQGKLVPQDPADEPASVLLQKIRAEKDRLIAEGKIKKDKPLAVIPDEEKPFELPVGWEWVRLGALASKLTDGSHNPPRDSGVGYPMLSSQNVWEAGVIDFTSPTRYVDEADFLIENSRTTAVPGDVLLTIVGSLGRSAVVPKGAPDFVLQRSVAVIRSGLDSDFLSLYLRAPTARAYYDLHGKGTAQKGIYLGKLGAMLIAVPPIAEQSRIVARVEELMRLCDALQAKGQLEATQHAQLLSTLLGTLTASATPDELANNWQRVAQHFDLLLDRPQAIDALEQTLLQLAVRGLLVPQDPTDEPASVLLVRVMQQRAVRVGKSSKSMDEKLPLFPYQLPERWTWAQLGDLVENMGSGWSPACDEGERSDPMRWAVLRTTAVQVNEFRPREHKALPSKLSPRPEIEVQYGDVLITRAGPMNRVGISCWVDQAPPRLMLSDKIVRFHPVANELLPAFIVLALNAGYTKDQIEAAKSGMAASQVNISQADLRGLWIPVCSKTEQSRIVTRVTQLRRLCFELRQRLAEREAVQARMAEALVQQVA